MRVRADEDHNVHYALPIGDDLLEMNALIGTDVSVKYEGTINCVACGRKSKKSFNQGYCYPCVTKLAQCDTCIIKPELCHYHEGTCREPQWGEENCLTGHFVYLSNTGAVKVGITRHVTDGISSRWIDQGATQAMAIMRVKNRLISGLVETAFKGHIADKTNWRTMLKGAAETRDLVELNAELQEKVAADIDAIRAQHGLDAVEVLSVPSHEIHYPVTQYPEKIKSINLDKEGEFSGTLLGMKGQYWMLDGDRVINMRKYAGYHLEITHA